MLERLFKKPVDDSTVSLWRDRKALGTEEYEKHAANIKNSLGWLEVVDWIRPHMEEILEEGLSIIRTHAVNMWVIDSLGALVPKAEIDKTLEEKDLHSGPPNSSIESHGYAKRVLDIYSRQLRKQYGLNAINCILQNMYGPEDSLDLSKTKVVMSLVKRFLEAKRSNNDNVELWGSGRALRQFLYVKDAAEILVKLLQEYEEEDPINVSPDEEVSIKELAETIRGLTGFNGDIIWDKTKGDGQLRKRLDNSKLKKYIDYNFTPLKVGLRETIEWYKNLGL